MRWRLTATNDRSKVVSQFSHQDADIMKHYLKIPSKALFSLKFFQVPTATTSLNYALCFSPLLFQPISISFNRD